MTTATIEISRTAQSTSDYVIPILSERTARVRYTAARSAELVNPTPAGGDVDDEHVRAYISHLWAEDWDSTEDSVYDTW
jgi:hypothetical protein